MGPTLSALSLPDCLIELSGAAAPSNLALIGGKAAGLQALMEFGVKTPPSLVLTCEAFERRLHEIGGLARCAQIEKALQQGNQDEAWRELAALQAVMSVGAPEELLEISQAARDRQGWRSAWAVRSSCIHEDGGDHSFAGMFDSFLNVADEDLLGAIAKCWASVYKPSNIFYAREHGLALADLRMAVILQPTFSPTAAGVAFSIDPRARSDARIVIEAVEGFSADLVAGALTPDRYIFSKANLALVTRSLGQSKSVLRTSPTGGLSPEPMKEGRAFAISTETARLVAKATREIESRFGRPMDIEWLVDDGLTIVQARPLKRLPTLAHQREALIIADSIEPVARGQPITDRIVRGQVRRVQSPTDRPALPDEIVVVDSIDVDWFPVLRNAGAVVAAEGGFTSHIAIILREHGIASVFAVGPAAAGLEDGAMVTVDCSSSAGRVYEGHWPGEITTVDPSTIYRPRVRTHAVTSTAEGLTALLQLPLSGIGLVRMEFLVAREAGIHPLAVADYDEGVLEAGDLYDRIRIASEGWPDARSWYVETLCNSICQFAVACPDQIVNVRLPDMLSDDYLLLAGGERYERQSDANPMLGWRGATKLISPEYRRALELDCAALKMAVVDRGFHNIALLLPFCRTPRDGAAAAHLIRKLGPQTARLGMMVEIPSNIVLGAEFANIFDFFLVGPMDLTQLTYAADRKTTRLGTYHSETAATKEMVKVFLNSIAGRRKDVFIGGWPLFQYFREYAEVATNNRLLLVELPDRLMSLFANLQLAELEPQPALPQPAQVFA